MQAKTKTPPPALPALPVRQLLTRRQAAERLGVAVGTVDRWASERSGPVFVKFGHGRRSPVRYPSDLLDDFIERHQVMPKQ
jgi:hypothetical protein